MNKFACKFFNITVFLLTLLSLVHLEIVQWKKCPTLDSNAPDDCEIHELRINPCKEAAEKKPCVVRRGISAIISFDYTSKFDAETLQSRAYWTNQLVDLPFLDMESNACLSTKCPATANATETYTMELPISKKYPVRSYDVKWKLWNEAEKECCFIFRIKIVK